MMSDTSDTLRNVMRSDERFGSQLQAANITDAAFAIADAIRHVGTDNRGVSSLAANLGEVADAIDRSGAAIADAIGKLADETRTASSWSSIADVAKALDRIADAMDRRGG
jgi:hypothetical protein